MGCWNIIEIMDVATLEKVKTLEVGWNEKFIFSPNAKFLTFFRNSPFCRAFTEWDLQTGSPVNNANSPEQVSEEILECCSAAYSGDGKVVGVLYVRSTYWLGFNGGCTIQTYSVPCGTIIYSHEIEGWVGKAIWTQGEAFQLASLNQESITIWEVGFTSGETPTKANNFPCPKDFHYTRKFLLLPKFSRFADVFEKRVMVWDFQNAEFLLEFKCSVNPISLAFSPDGCYFACTTSDLEFCLWKELSTGYGFYHKFRSSFSSPNLHFSPNGQSIITFADSKMELWCIPDLATPLSNILPETSGHDSQFIVDFYLDKGLAAVTQLGKRMVTVLDLNSGAAWLTVDTDVAIFGLMLTRTTLVVAGFEQSISGEITDTGEDASDAGEITEDHPWPLCYAGHFVTWNLPERASALGTRVDASNSIQMVPFKSSWNSPVVLTILSSESNYLAAFGSHHGPASENVSNTWFYDMESGMLYDISHPEWKHFGVWSIHPRGREVQKLVFTQDRTSSFLEPTCYLPKGWPDIPCHYMVWGTSWVVNSNGEKLIWLPPHWQSNGLTRKWDGQFLALLHSELTEAVILEMLH